jgi:putative SOS response-associated peptidase YedK
MVAAWSLHGRCMVGASALRGTEAAMCGRYKLEAGPKTLVEAFAIAEVDPAPDVPPERLWDGSPAHNVAPTRVMPIVRTTTTGARQLTLAHWGLLPPWAREVREGSRATNARAETVWEKPTFRQPVQSQRCVVPVDGFYEWRAEQVPGKRAGATVTKKTPQLFARDDGRPFALAGLWSVWRKGPAPLCTFALLTTAANDLVGPIHDRMPVLLDDAGIAAWLAADAAREVLAPLVAPRPWPHMVVRAADPHTGQPPLPDDALGLTTSGPDAEAPGERSLPPPEPAPQSQPRAQPQAKAQRRASARQGSLF